MKLLVNNKEIYSVSTLVSKLVIELPTGNVDIHLPVGYQNLNITVVAKDMVAAPLDAAGHPTFVPKALITEDVAKELSKLSSIYTVEQRDKAGKTSDLQEILNRPAVAAAAAAAAQEKLRFDAAQALKPPQQREDEAAAEAKRLAALVR